TYVCSIPIVSPTGYYFIDIWQEIAYSFYTSQYEPYNLTNYVYKEPLAIMYLYNSTNLSIKDILFSDSYWYVFDTQKYYNSSNLIYWNTSQRNYGLVVDYSNFYNLVYDVSNLLSGYIYYPYENGILTGSYVSPCEKYINSILYTNYNPIVNLTNLGGKYILNLSLTNIPNYQNYYIYIYANPNINLGDARFLAFSTQIPEMKINYIEEINAININNLVDISKNYPDAYFYIINANITIYNGTVYNGNLISNYKYSQLFDIYILNTKDVNSLYKDQMIIYIK
ncbi:MAG: hypothetical protein ACP5G1_01140, partial [Nanopusillaceae archaeon]